VVSGVGEGSCGVGVAGSGSGAEGGSCCPGGDASIGGVSPGVGTGVTPCESAGCPPAFCGGVAVSGALPPAPAVKEPGVSSVGGVPVFGAVATQAAQKDSRRSDRIIIKHIRADFMRTTPFT